IEKNGEDYLAIKIVAGSLPLIGGGALAVLGFFLLIIFLSVRIKNPLPGSMLTLRGWKGPDQVSASDRAQAKAWQAIQWGYFASQTWILPFFFGSYHALLRPTSFTNQILLLLIVVCSVFYALGIRLCRRRDPASVAAAPRTWKVALAFNYGGLLGFVGSVGTLFFMRFRA
ncbi:MAG TPA: hypothetical protein VK961_07515, partial [Chthoniobacter sp.]|nr:hypothetical protein [Chthoniobacter sp.]